MRKKGKAKFLALLLACVLVFGTTGTALFAEDVNEDDYATVSEVEEEETSEITEEETEDVVDEVDIAEVEDGYVETENDDQTVYSSIEVESIEETTTEESEVTDEDEYEIQTLADQGMWTVGNSSSTYPTIEELNEALATLEEEDSVTVRLSDDVKGCLVIPEGITVNLRLSSSSSGSGNTLSNEGYNSHTITNKGTLKIENYAGTVESVVDGCAALYNDSGATVSGIALGTFTASGYYTIVNKGYISITGTNVVVNNTSDDYSTILNGFTEDEENDENNVAELTISRGTYNGDKYCIENTSSGKLTISSGTFNGTGEKGGCLLNYGTVTISSSSATFVANGHVMELKEGSTTTISNGTFSAPGPVIVVEESATLNITNGTFTSTDGVTDPIQVNGPADITISEKAKFSPAHEEVVFGDPVAKVNDVEYTSIKSAVDEAEAGDTVYLLDNVTVEVGSSAYVTVDKNITINLCTYTITVVDGDSSGGSLFEVSKDVTFNLCNGTVSGGTEEAGEISPSAKAYVILTENEGATIKLNEVTIQGFNTTSGVVNTSGADLKVYYCNFNYNFRAISCRNGEITNCNFKGNGATTEGAAVHALVETKLKITGCTFTGNSTTVSGGAVYASRYGDNNEASIFITENTFKCNTSNYGGAIYIGNIPGQLQVTGNTISNNSAANGGGIYFASTCEGSVTDDYDFSGNTITNNSATQRGGGMTLAVDSDREIAIRSGTIANNYAGEYGGGIDYTPHRSATLRLYNALITANSAQYGGGLWACPSATTTMHVVFGGAIYGNTATSTGNSIRFEGEDSFYQDENGGGGVFVTVSPRALGGGLMDWYADDLGARYSEGDDPVDVSVAKYNDTNLSFGLYGELSEESQKLASEAATLYIYDNSAGEYGGGVATNGIIDFGGVPGERDTEYDTVDLKAEKIWVDGKGEEIEPPVDSVEVTLVRVDADGTKHDLETVEISEETDWCWEFKDLPTSYMKVADNGVDYEVQHYTYELREANIDGYYVDYSECTMDEEEKDLNITITNEKMEELQIRKETVGSDAPDSFDFEISLSIGEEAYDGNVNVTYSKGDNEDIKADRTGIVEFEDGKATVTIQSGETATLVVGSGLDWSVKELDTENAKSTQISVGEEDVSNDDNIASGTITGTTKVLFVNSYRDYFPLDEEIVTDEEDIFERSAWVPRESVNEYNAIEIEMSTNLPIVTAEDLAAGEFTMNFHNQLDHELVLDEADTDFSVYIGEQKISHEYYTITLASGLSPLSLQPYSVSPVDDGCSFHVDVDLTALYNDGIVTEDMLDGNTDITIFFFVDLEGTDLNGSYKSTAWYNVSDGDDIVYTSDVATIEVYTYEIEIEKYDSTDEDLKLAGATFGIYYDEECTEENAVIRNGEPYTTVSDEDGMAVFYGLADGTYYVKELQEPEGYVLSDEVLTIELDETLTEPEYDYTYYATFANTPAEEPVLEDDTGEPLPGEPTDSDDGSTAGTGTGTNGDVNDGNSGSADNAGNATKASSSSSANSSGSDSNASQSSSAAKTADANTMLLYALLLAACVIAIFGVRAGLVKGEQSRARNKHNM